MNAGKPVLGVDFDDVIAAFNNAFYAWHNRCYGTNIPYEGIVTFNMCEMCGVDLETIYDRTRIFVHDHHNLILPTTGVTVALCRLSRSFNLHVVTSRCESTRDITEGWLMRHGLRDYLGHLHFTNGFNSIHPDRKRNKAEVLQKIGAIGLIEDSDDNAHAVAESGIPVVMPERPWNGNRPHELVTRVSSWRLMTDHLLQSV